MNKEMIISIIIVVCILIANSLTQDYTQKSAEAISNELLVLKEEVSNENKEYEIIKEKMDAVVNEWMEVHPTLAYYIAHNELEKVETQIFALKSNVETQSYDYIIEKIDTCSFILDHIVERESFSLENIF